jgi:hypothetical protein
MRVGKEEREENDNNIKAIKKEVKARCDFRKELVRN